MTIRVACPSCAKQFRLADSAARKIRCNACGSVIVVDGAASTNRTSQPRSDRPDSTNVAAVKSVAIRERAVGHSPAARVAEGRRAVPPSHSQKRTNGLFSLSTCLIGIGVSLLAVTAIAVAMVWPRGNIAAVPQVAERPEIPAASAIDREPAAKIVAATGTAAEDPRPEKPAAKQPRTESPPAPVDAAKPPVSAKAIKFRNIETAAVVDRTGMPVGTLFETRMIAAAKLNWVERSRIAQVIAEQNLQAFFGADAGAQRAALARTLKADVLAMVRSRTERSPENPAKLNKVVNLVVFESQRGLRLAAATIPASDNAEKDADALAAIFAGAMEKLSEKITHVFAVPGFVSQDFDYRYRYLTGAFSLHVERHLQHRKGLLLVELAEAKSLAAEVAVAGDAIDRQLPFYLLGEYRNDGAGDALRMKFTLKVQRGDAIVATRTREGIKAADVPNAVLAMADEVVDQALACKIATPHVVPDRAVEIKQLGERAITFQRNGEWVQCVEMLEAAFLLDPNQLEMRRRACQVYSMIAHLHRGRAQHNMTEAMLSMEAYRRALEHLEVGYRPTKNLEPPRVPGSRPWMDPFPGDEFLNASINMRDYRGFVPESEAFARHYQDLLDFERRIILDMVRARARAGYGDEFRFLGFILYRATPEQQVQIVRSLVQELKDLPMAKERTISLSKRFYSSLTLALRNDPTYLTDLEKDSNPALRAAAKFLRDDLVRDRAAHEKWEEAKKKELEQPDDLKASPARRISLMVTGGTPKEVGKELSRILSECIPLGPGQDLLICENTFYLMREKGKLLQIWQAGAKATRINHACFDGRYAWICVRDYRGSPTLLVFDPIAVKVHEIKAEDGLPTIPRAALPDGYTQQMLMVAPLGPGRALVVGSFGRSWIGLAQFDPNGNKSLKIFFEARETTNELKDNSWKNTNIAFAPKYAYTLNGPNGDQRVIIGRESFVQFPFSIYDRPLLVDPKTKSVVAMDASIHTPSLESAQVCANGVYYHEGIASGQKLWLVRLEYPGKQVRTTLGNVPDGRVRIVGDDVFVTTLNSWLVGSISKNQIARVGSNNSFSGRAWLPREGGPSNHYGYLVEGPRINRQHAYYQLTRDALGDSAERK